MKKFASLVCWLGSLWWLPATHAQTVRVMQWNLHGTLGNIASNNTAGAKAIARIINYNRPDVLLFDEIESETSLGSGTTNLNGAALVDWVTNNVPYLGTQAGVTFFISLSSQDDNYTRSGAISRYPTSNNSTYNDGLRGLHSFQVQLTTNRLQIFHTHLKCCADDCPRKQTEAQFDADTMTAWAATNSLPFIFAGDLNEDEERPECTLSAAYHPISTILTNGGLVDFKPTTLDGVYRTWNTAAAAPTNRLDYIFAATNRLSVATGFVFSTMNWAAHGLYTNASPQNLVNDSRTASDHYCVFADYVFTPTILAIAKTNSSILITWNTGVGKTNALQRTAGGPSGSYSNNFTDLFLLTNVIGSVTNHLDVGGATNTPSRYYRVRHVP